MSRHPNSHMQEVVEYAEENGWELRLCKKGHAWGRIYCPHNDRDGCLHSINGTPQSPQHDAKRLRKLIDRCPHKDIGQTQDKDSQEDKDQINDNDQPEEKL